MKYKNDSIESFQGIEWQVLGEIDLPAGSNTEEAINTQLVHLLKPLYLQIEFLNKVVKSAQDAATRAFQAEAEMKSDHVHVLIFVPPYNVSKEKTWGFFRIEKVESAIPDKHEAAHAIEFYLYLEG